MLVQDPLARGYARCEWTNIPPANYIQSVFGKTYSVSGLPGQVLWMDYLVGAPQSAPYNSTTRAGQAWGDGVGDQTKCFRKAMGEGAAAPETWYDCRHQDGPVQILSASIFRILHIAIYFMPIFTIYSHSIISNHGDHTVV